jgi:hypothetical protein
MNPIFASIVRTQSSTPYNLIVRVTPVFSGVPHATRIRTKYGAHIRSFEWLVAFLTQLGVRNRLVVTQFLDLLVVLATPPLTVVGPVASGDFALPRRLLLRLPERRPVSLPLVVVVVTEAP